MTGFKHGWWNTPTWRSWDCMISRCTRKSVNSYERYGGRGIAVCERWLSFANFLSDMGERPNGMTLDRYPDRDGNYEPGNCRWATYKEQARGRSSNVLLTHNGETKPLRAWADECGVHPGTLERRIQKGWPAERALNPADGRVFRRDAKERRSV